MLNGFNPYNHLCVLDLHGSISCQGQNLNAKYSSPALVKLVACCLPNACQGFAKVTENYTESGVCRLLNIQIKRIRGLWCSSNMLSKFCMSIQCRVLAIIDFAFRMSSFDGRHISTISLFCCNFHCIALVYVYNWYFFITRILRPLDHNCHDSNSNSNCYCFKQPPVRLIF